MNYIVNYFWEASICLLAFYIFYVLVQKKETTYQYNRLYLLGAIGLSLILPALELSIPFASENLSSVSFEQMVRLPEITVGAETATDAGFNWLLLLAGVYAVGVVFLLGRLFFELFKIFQLTRNLQRKEMTGIENAVILPTHGLMPTFSFLHYIFWDETSGGDEKEREYILHHELVHVRNRHTWDILFMELVAIFFWFNPLIYLYKNAIKDAHEYLADAEAARNAGKSQYIKALANQSLKQFNLSLIHPFNKSQIMKRIAMLEKSWNKSGWIKMTLIIPVVAAMALVFSCQNESLFDDNPLTQLPEGWTLLKEKNASQEDLRSLEEFKIKHTELRFYLVEFELQRHSPFVNGNKFWSLSGGRLDEESKTFIGVARMHPDGNSPMKDRRNIQPVDEEFEGETFTIVEEQPQPEGGMQAFYKYVQENLKYPEQARADTIQGKVYVQFVVDKDGSITDAKTIKGIGGGCDEEAVRVIANSPKWIPGKQRGEAVKVRMILPITFKLD